MGGGTQLAHASADMVLLSENLQHLVVGVGMARRSLWIIKQNFAWAIGYNLLAVPLAAAATSALLARIPARGVFVLGVCGGLSPDLAVGDLVLLDQAQVLDRVEPLHDHRRPTHADREPDRLPPDLQEIAMRQIVATALLLSLTTACTGTASVPSLPEDGGRPSLELELPPLIPLEVVLATRGFDVLEDVGECKGAEVGAA